jgi:polysaccharide biosynthesis protein PslG
VLPPLRLTLRIFATALAVGILMPVAAGAAASKPKPQAARETTVTRKHTAAVANRVGFSSHLDFMSPSDGYAYMKRATGVGVRWFREDFAWSVLQPQKGRFNWAPTDALMTNASRLGANILAMVGYAPGWASGHPESDKYPPLDPADYGAFTAAIAGRYGRGGTFWRENPGLAPRPLAGIEVWNEPWLWSFWRPNPDAAAYAALVRAAAPAIKAVDPRIQVLISGDLHFGWADGKPNSWLDGWLTEMLRQKLPMDSIDGWSVHPYCGNRGPLQSTITGFADQMYAQQWLYQQLPLVRDMTKRAGKFRPIWSTEVGWSTTGDVDPATQADFVRDAIRRATGAWSSFVARTFVYTLEKPHNGDHDGGYSLLNDDLSPKPAWNALAQALSAA